MQLDASIVSGQDGYTGAATIVIIAGDSRRLSSRVPFFYPPWHSAAAQLFDIFARPSHQGTLACWARQISQRILDAAAWPVC